MTELHANRLVLARAVLDGDQESHLILADLLEDEGNRGAADWARAKKRNHYKRMDFVIGVLPYGAALQVAADSLSHSLSLIRSHAGVMTGYWQFKTDALQTLIDSTNAVSRWAQGAENALREEHLARVGRVTRSTYNIHDIDLLMQAFHVAITSAQIARSQEARGTDARAHVSSSRDASRRVTRGARQMVKPMVADLAWQVRRRTIDLRESDLPDVAAWQLNHLKTILDDAIAALA